MLKGVSIKRGAFRAFVVSACLVYLFLLEVRGARCCSGHFPLRKFCPFLVVVLVGLDCRVFLQPTALLNAPYA